MTLPYGHKDILISKWPGSQPQSPNCLLQTRATGNLKQTEPVVVQLQMRAHQVAEEVDVLALGGAGPDDVVGVEPAAGGEVAAAGRALRRLDLVELGGDHGVGHAVGPQPLEHLLVERGRTDRAVDQHEHLHEVLAFEQVALDHLRPVLADPVGDLGVAVAGEVDERAASLELEHVDQLGAPRRVADPGQLLGVGEGVDERRLADVGPSDERDLGARLGELRRPRRRRHEPQSQRSAVHQPTMSEPSAHTAATNPSNAIARLRAIGARVRFAWSRCTSGGRTIAATFPTNRAPPSASTSQANRSSPRNIPS